MAGGIIIVPIQAYVGMAGLSPVATNNAAQCFILGLAPQRDVGYVTKDVSFILYLWNGTQNDAVLTSVSSTGDTDDIAWDAAPPKVVTSLRSQRVVVTVGMDGPLVFASDITFNSSCNTVILHVTGTRAPHLSGDVGYLFFPHNWENGLDESLSWKTDVLIAHDRTEQRIQLRTMPRRSFDLRLLVSGAARRKLETWLGLRKTRYLFSPVWRDTGMISTALAAGSSTVFVDQPEYLDFSEGRWLAVYDSWNHFEIRTVTGIGANFVAVDAPFLENWPDGSKVVPCRYGLGLAQRRISRFTEEVAEYAITFEALNESLMPTMATPDLYLNVPVCPFVPSWINPEESLDNKWVRLDNDTGWVEYDIQSIEPVMTREASFLLIGRAAIDQLLRFLFACAGRLAPFWMAANDRSFDLAATAALGASTIIISPIDYEYSLSGSPARSCVELITTDGTIIRRRITAIATLPSGNEQLTIDAPLPMAISSATLNRCSWMEQVRLDSDDLKLHWISGECLEITLPIVVLP